MEDHQRYPWNENSRIYIYIYLDITRSGRSDFQHHPFVYMSEGPLTHTRRCTWHACTRARSARTQTRVTNTMYFGARSKNEFRVEKKWAGNTGERKRRRGWGRCGGRRAGAVFPRCAWMGRVRRESLENYWQHRDIKGVGTPASAESAPSRRTSLCPHESLAQLLSLSLFLSSLSYATLALFLASRRRVRRSLTWEEELRVPPPPLPALPRVRDRDEKPVRLLSASVPRKSSRAH